MEKSQSPVKVDSDGIASMQHSLCEPSNSISVQSAGEITLSPDTIQFTISVRSSKESLEDAQASVKRRVDYITQVLRKNGIKNNDVALSTEINRKNAVGVSQGESELVTVVTYAVVKCDSISKCEMVRNVLIEKMDSSVLFSPVSFWHSLEAKETGRQEAFKRAVTSAKAKAECISLTVGVKLGSAVEVRELSQHSFETSTLSKQGTEQMGSNGGSFSGGLYQRHANGSLTFVSQVFVCFGTLPVQIYNHRKSHKH